MAQLFTGYSGQIWSVAYGAMAAFSLSLASSGVTLANQAQSAEALFQTLRNGIDAINAQATVLAWQLEAVNLQSAQALPIPISPTDTAYIENRTNAYINAAQALAAIIPTPVIASYADTIAVGKVAIPDMGLLEFYQNFTFEVAPPGLDATTVYADAAAVSTAFNNLTTAIATFQGTFTTQSLDTAIRERNVASLIALNLNAFTSGPISATANNLGLWNQTVAVPSMNRISNAETCAPFSQVNQQSACIRNAMLMAMQQVAVLLLALRQPQSGQINFTTLRNNETLMDVAARATGNFENWVQIATLNGLQPPYVGPQTLSGVAGWGSKLLLPSTGTASSTTGMIPDYNINFLGVDLYFGPINGLMPPWTGDFQTISGVNNLRMALGRRVQTTLGALIYHGDYGSRIPPEVGNVQAQDTAAHIASYGKSALLKDGRVQTVASATATLIPNSKISFQASVLPGGFNTTPLSVNEVISPLP